MRRAVKVFLSGVLAVSLFASQVAWAGYVPSTQAMQSQQIAQQRADIISLLDRKEVRDALEQQGLSSEEAKARIAMLSPAQVEQLKTKIDTLPAGEGALGAVVGALLVVFLILLFTDIIGETDVYDFDD